MKFVEILVCLSALGLTAAVPLQKVDCSYRIIGDDIYCFLRDLQLTTRNYRFIPWSENITAVRNVVIERSTIPILSSDICDTFENLQYLNFYPSDIEVIKPGALKKCVNLRFLSLASQKIAHLDKDTFAGLVNLESLYLAGNRLSQLHDDLFVDLKAMTNVHLYVNRLTEFSTALVQKTRRLQHLLLYSNEIFDLEMSGLLDDLPALQSFSFDDNNLRCDRLPEVLAELKERNITSEINRSLIRRTFGFSKFDNYICLKDETWRAQYQKHLIEQQTRELYQKNEQLFTNLILTIKMQ